METVLAFVPYALFDAEGFLRDIWAAFTGLFGGTAQDAIEKAMKDLVENTPSLNLSDPLFGLYDGFLAISILLAILAAAIQLFKVIYYEEWSTAFDVVKIVVLTFFFGAMLPYVTFKATEIIGDVNRGMVEWLLNKPFNESFNIDLIGSFGFMSSLTGWIGGKLLQIESFLFVEYMPISLLLLALAFGLRWLGVLGDGLFVIAAGLTLMLLLGTTMMLLILALFWAGASGPVGPGYISVATFVAALSPFVIFGLYFKLGLNERVKGVMQTKMMSTKSTVRRQSSGSESGGLSHKLIAGTVGVGAGYLMAREDRKESGDTSTFRDRASQGIRTWGAIAPNPVTKVAALYGSKAIKPKPKPKPPPGPQGPRPGSDDEVSHE